MRQVLALAVALAFVPGALRAEEAPRQAPKVVLKSPDGKQSYDLAKLTQFRTIEVSAANYSVSGNQVVLLEVLRRAKPLR